jgi:hypothetical protein
MEKKAAPPSADASTIKASSGAKKNASMNNQAGHIP